MPENTKTVKALSRRLGYGDVEDLPDVYGRIIPVPVDIETFGHPCWEDFDRGWQRDDFGFDD